jgi:hypothetical protein
MESFIVVKMKAWLGVAKNCYFDLMEDLGSKLDA